MLDSPASPATIPISLWSTIPRPTIHAVCNVTSISRAQKQPPITEIRITQTQIAQARHVP
jgi:hypothetical protein